MKILWYVDQTNSVFFLSKQNNQGHPLIRIHIYRHFRRLRLYHLISRTRRRSRIDVSRTNRYRIAASWVPTRNANQLRRALAKCERTCVCRCAWEGGEEWDSGERWRRRTSACGKGRSRAIEQAGIPLVQSGLRASFDLSCRVGRERFPFWEKREICGEHLSSCGLPRIQLFKTYRYSK